MKIDRDKKFIPFIPIISVWFVLHCHSPKSKLDLSAFLFPSPLSEIYFSYPGRNVTKEKKRIVRDVILSEIQKSKESIRMYVYSIDDYEIISALYAKKRTGVNIQIYGDKDEDYKELESFGFKVQRWEGSGIHHTKIMLFDRKRMFLGTGNFTSHGLETDHNVYWIQNLKLPEYDALVYTLEGKNLLGTVEVGGLKYIFSPDAGFEIQAQILEAIDSAKVSIQYLIYSHFDPVISLKLLEASKRGVRVWGIYNSPKQTNPEAIYLSQHLPFPSQIWEDGNVDFVYEENAYKGGLLHHKTMVIDERDVYVGSYNYSVSARDNNKEVFVKMSHPLITNEFLKEWKRIESNAIPLIASNVSADTDQTWELHSFMIKRFYNPLYETNLFFQETGNFDSNSNALAKPYQQSLGWVGIPKNNGLEKEWGRFDWEKVEPDPIWEMSEGTDISLSLQNYFLGTRVSLSNGEKIHSISIWDGSNPKELIPIDPNSIAVGRTNFRQGKNLWMWVHTEKRTISFCHTRQKNTIPRWIVFLLNRLQAKQNQSLLCSND
ncbi:lipoprotein [Leptospira ellinghausenii]|uniref:phospholipase D n=1 Tax=Leptospira ellinghausenii TaxID=1917822 RepID=A0A2P2D9H1_9LEPT|nr:phospholipase D-like domain-containing protein [Leptospira ellinghausenii]GBF41284.1 lipoprotein [Leptospira ellinghausenii]